MSSDNAKIHPLFAVPENAPEDSPAHDESVVTNQPAVCAYCYGSGMEVVAGKGAKRCRCKAELNRTKLLEAARIPRRYEQCSLQNYFPVKGNGTQMRAFNYAFRLAREYPGVDRGLLFMGTVGV